MNFISDNLAKSYSQSLLLQSHLTSGCTSSLPAIRSAGPLLVRYSNPSKDALDF